MAYTIQKGRMSYTHKHAHVGIHTCAIYMYVCTYICQFLHWLVNAISVKHATNDHKKVLESFRKDITLFDLCPFA